MSSWLSNLQIGNFVAGFGIAGDDLDRLFALIRARELDIIVEDPAGDAAMLVDRIGTELAGQYVL